MPEPIQVRGYTVIWDEKARQWVAVNDRDPAITLRGTAEELDIAVACLTRSAIADFAELLRGLPTATAPNRDHDLETLRELVARYPREAAALAAAESQKRLPS